MTQNELLRAEVRRLLKWASQKQLSDAMGISQSTFSRWLRDQPDSKGRPVKIPLDAIDGVIAIKREILSDVGIGLTTVTPGETQRDADSTPSSAEGGFPERRSTDKGPPAGTTERRKTG